MLRNFVNKFLKEEDFDTLSNQKLLSWTSDLTDICRNPNLIKEIPSNIKLLWQTIASKTEESHKKSLALFVTILTILFIKDLKNSYFDHSETERVNFIKMIMFSISNSNKILPVKNFIALVIESYLFVQLLTSKEENSEMNLKFVFHVMQFMMQITGKLKKIDEAEYSIGDVKSLLNAFGYFLDPKLFNLIKVIQAENTFIQFTSHFIENALLFIVKLDSLKCLDASTFCLILKKCFQLLEVYSDVNPTKFLEILKKFLPTIKSSLIEKAPEISDSVDQYISLKLSKKKYEKNDMNYLPIFFLWAIENSKNCLPSLEAYFKILPSEKSMYSVEEKHFFFSIELLLYFIRHDLKIMNSPSVSLSILPWKLDEFLSHISNTPLSFANSEIHLDIIFKLLVNLNRHSVFEGNLFNSCDVFSRSISALKNVISAKDSAKSSYSIIIKYLTQLLQSLFLSIKSEFYFKEVSISNLFFCISEMIKELRLQVEPPEANCSYISQLFGQIGSGITFITQKHREVIKYPSYQTLDEEIFLYTNKPNHKISGNNELSLIAFMSLQMMNAGHWERYMLWVNVILRKDDVYTSFSKDQVNRYIDNYVNSLLKFMNDAPSNTNSLLDKERISRILSVILNSLYSLQILSRLVGKIYQYTLETNFSINNFLFNFLNVYEILMEVDSSDEKKYILFSSLSQSVLHLLLTRPNMCDQSDNYEYTRRLASYIPLIKQKLDGYIEIFDQTFTSKKNKASNSNQQTSPKKKNLSIQIDLFQMVGHLNSLVLFCKMKVSLIENADNTKDKAQIFETITKSLDKILYCFNVISKSIKNEDPRFSKKSYIETIEFIEISMRSTFELLNFIGDEDRLSILMNHSICFGKFFSEDCSEALQNLNALFIVDNLIRGKKKDILTFLQTTFLELICTLPKSSALRHFFELTSNILLKYINTPDDQPPIILPEEYTEYDKATNQVFHEYKNSRNFLLASVFMLLASRVVHKIWKDFKRSLTFSKKSLGIFGKTYFGPNDLYSFSYRVEAMLTIIDNYEKMGSAHKSIAYIPEIVIHAANSSPAVFSTIHFQLLRIWCRTTPCKVLSTFDDLENAPKFKFDAKTQKISEIVHKLKSFIYDKSSSQSVEEKFELNYLTSEWMLAKNVSEGISFLDMNPFYMNKWIEIMRNQGVKKNNSILSFLKDAHFMQEVKYSFDILRSIRRNCAFEIINSPLSECIDDDSSNTDSNVQLNSSFQTFLLNSSSCMVSMGISNENYEIDIDFCDETRVENLRNKITEAFLCDSAGGIEGAICSLSYEKNQSCLIFSRFDTVSTYSVCLNVKQEITLVLEEWLEILNRNDKQLKLTSTEVSSWSEKDKKLWWDSRNKIDTDLNKLMSKIESILGCWKCLVVQFGAEKDENDGLYYYTNIDANIKKALNTIKLRFVKLANINSKTTTVLSNMLTGTISWIQLILQAYISNINSKKLTHHGLHSVLVSTAKSLSIHDFKESDDMIENIFKALEIDQKESKLKSSEAFDLKSISKSLQLFDQEENDADNDNLTIDYETWKISDLKLKLKEKNLSTVGRKNDLILRLKESIDKDKKIPPIQTKNNTPSTAGLQKAPYDTKEKVNIAIKHTILILDENLHSIPWEALPCIKKMSCSRVPSLNYLISRLNASECSHNKLNSGANSVDTLSCDNNENLPPNESIINKNRENVLVRNCWYAVDPEGNLPGTRKTMMDFLNPLVKQWSWKGYAGELPSIETVKLHHDSSDLFIYCGHGAGEAMCEIHRLDKIKCPASFLWGCSSGKLVSYGIHDPIGPAIIYLMNGSPWIVGNLWDVTDKDIDRLSISCMTSVMKASSILLGESQEDTQGNVLKSLPDARDACKLKGIVGCAPVIYGVPNLIHFD